MTVVTSNFHPGVIMSEVTIVVDDINEVSIGCYLIFTVTYTKISQKSLMMPAMSTSFNGYLPRRRNYPRFHL